MYWLKVLHLACIECSISPLRLQISGWDGHRLVLDWFDRAHVGLRGNRGGSLVSRQIFKCILTLQARKRYAPTKSLG